MLHTDPSPESQNKVDCALLLDVVVGERPAVLELFARKDEALLVGGDTLLVLDLAFDHVNGVCGLYFKCDGLASEGLNEDLNYTVCEKLKYYK